MRTPSLAKSHVKARAVGGTLLACVLFSVHFSQGRQNDHWHSLAFARPNTWETVTAGEDDIAFLRPAWNFSSGLWIKMEKGPGGQFRTCSSCQIRRISGELKTVANFPAEEVVYEQRLAPPIGKASVPLDGRRIAQIHLLPTSQHPDASSYWITYSLEGGQRKQAAIARILQSLRFND